MRANRRMIDRKIDRSSGDAVATDGSFHISVFANGRMYCQVVTEKQIRDAFGKALKSRGSSHV